MKAIVFLTLTLCSLLLSCSSYNKLKYGKIHDNPKSRIDKNEVVAIPQHTHEQSEVLLNETNTSVSKEYMVDDMANTPVISRANEDSEPFHSRIKKDKLNFETVKFEPELTDLIDRKSAARDSFDNTHWAMTGLLIITAIGLFIMFLGEPPLALLLIMILSFIIAYVLSFVVRRKAINVPIEEQDQTFRRRITLSKVISIVGLIVLILCGILLFALSAAL